MTEYITFGLLNAFTDFIEKPFIAAAGKMLDSSLGDSQLQSVIKVVSLTTTGGGQDYSMVWNVVSSAFSYALPFGYALLVTYFLMFMLESAAKEQVTIESIVKVLIELVLVVALIGNLETICNSFLSIGESILYKFDGGGANQTFSNSITITGTEMAEQWLATGEDTAITIMLQALVMWLIHQIAIIAIDFAAFSRILELSWRIAFAPIGVANCFEGGVNSAGIKYLKSILAVALSGAAIFVIAACGFALTASLISAPTKSAMWLGVGALFATSGACIGAGAKVKEIVS